MEAKLKVEIKQKVKAIDDKTLTFLEKHEQVFMSINTDNMLAIHSFCILWMIFENRIFKASASADKIIKKVKLWSKNNQLNDFFWLKDLGYFKDRYFRNGDMTGYYHNLRIREEDSTLVKDVLQGKNNTSQDALTVALLIVLRFRNNLFHGSKWPAGMTNQKENLDTCSNILRLCLERFGQRTTNTC